MIAKCGNCRHYQPGLTVDGRGTCTCPVTFPACCYAIGYQRRTVHPSDGSRSTDVQCSRFQPNESLAP